MSTRNLRKYDEGQDQMSPAGTIRKGKKKNISDRQEAPGWKKGAMTRTEEKKNFSRWGKKHSEGKEIKQRIKYNRNTGRGRKTSKKEPEPE